MGGDSNCRKPWTCLRNGPSHLSYSTLPIPPRPAHLHGYKPSVAASVVQQPGVDSVAFDRSLPRCPRRWLCRPQLKVDVNPPRARPEVESVVHLPRTKLVTVWRQGRQLVLGWQHGW